MFDYLEGSDDRYDAVSRGKEASKQLVTGKYQLKKRFGTFLLDAKTSSEFESRLGLVSNDIYEVVRHYMPSVSDPVAKLKTSLRREWEGVHKRSNQGDYYVAIYENNTCKVISEDEVEDVLSQTVVLGVDGPFSTREEAQAVCDETSNKTHVESRRGRRFQSEGSPGRYKILYKGEDPDNVPDSKTFDDLEEARLESAFEARSLRQHPKHSKCTIPKQVIGFEDLIEESSRSGKIRTSRTLGKNRMPGVYKEHEGPGAKFVSVTPDGVERGTKRDMEERFKSWEDKGESGSDSERSNRSFSNGDEMTGTDKDGNEYTGIVVNNSFGRPTIESDGKRVTLTDWPKTSSRRRRAQRKQSSSKLYLEDAYNVFIGGEPILVLLATDLRPALDHGLDLYDFLYLVESTDTEFTSEMKNDYVLINKSGSWAHIKIDRNGTATVVDKEKAPDLENAIIQVEEYLNTDAGLDVEFEPNSHFV